MALKDRIRELVDAGYKKSQLAKAAGKSPAAVTHWLNGETHEIKADSAAGLQVLTGFSAVWIATGKGQKYAPKRQLESGPAEAPNIEPASASRPVPVVSWVQAGDWCGMVDALDPADAPDWLPCPIRHGPHTYALIVRGVSMFDPTGSRSFKDGDTIFVDPDRQADHRSLVIARLDDEKEATFKQLLVEGGHRMLQALNPSWPERIIRINGNCTLCGVVIGKVESFI